MCFAPAIAPAMAAGCTIVIKPAEQTPLSALALAELAQPLEDFFNEVMVLDEDLKIRNQRLNLLVKLRSQFSYIADFSKW